MLKWPEPPPDCSLAVGYSMSGANNVRAVDETVLTIFSGVAATSVGAVAQC